MLTLNLKMPLSEAAAVSAIGIVTVMIILTVIAMLIILLSKAVRAIESKAMKAAKDTKPSISAGVQTEKISQGQVDLIGTDEKTAAVIMAIVSQRSNIPPERLSFKSIKLADNGKGAEENDK